MRIIFLNKGFTRGFDKKTGKVETIKSKKEMHVQKDKYNFKGD